MKQFDHDEQLNEYLDGALTGAALAEFELAMESDPALRVGLEAARRIQRMAAALPARLEPPRDLWADIEGRLSPRQPNLVTFTRRSLPRRSSISLLAAAAALLLVSGFTLWNVSRQSTPLTEVVAEAPPAADSQTPQHHAPAVEAWLQAQNEADLAYENARAELLDALAKRKEELTPETRAVLRDNMAVIENAVHEINLALADDPQNSGLRHMLASTRVKELTLLEQIVSGPSGL